MSGFAVCGKMWEYFVPSAAISFRVLKTRTVTWQGWCKNAFIVQMKCFLLLLKLKEQ